MRDQQNLLIIQTDQQARWTLSCYGGKEVETPHIDSLCQEGVRFDEFYTPSAVCTPSRGCFLTGEYPHVHGAYRNGMAINPDQTTFAHVLQERGYETGYVGKWHLAGDEAPNWLDKRYAMGFDKCDYMINNIHQKKVIERPGTHPALSYEIGDKETYTTDWLTDKFIQMIEETGEGPFCYMLSIPDPHQPYCVREPYDTMFEPKDVWIPETFYEQELPDWAQDDEWGRKRYFPIDVEDREDKLRYIKSQYLGAVKCIDDNVGKILAHLEQNNLMDNTVIVFTTDHGEYMGEHGLLEKNNLYDSVYHLPLIIKSNQLFKGQRKINKYMSMVDFKGTILGLLGIGDTPAILKEEAIEEAWVDEIYIHPNDVPRVGIITPEYQLAYVGQGWQTEREFTDHILFHRINDPNQTNNLFNQAAYQEVVEILTQKIVNHHKALKTPLESIPVILHEMFL